MVPSSGSGRRRETLSWAKPDPRGRETGLRFPSFLPTENTPLLSLPGGGREFDVTSVDGFEEIPPRSMTATRPPSMPSRHLLFARGTARAQRSTRQSADEGKIMPFSDVVPISQADGAIPLCPLRQLAPLGPPGDEPARHRTDLADRTGRQVGQGPRPPAAMNRQPSPRRPPGHRVEIQFAHQLRPVLVELERGVATRAHLDGLVSRPRGGTRAPTWSGRRKASRAAYMCTRPEHYERVLWCSPAVSAGRSSWSSPTWSSRTPCMVADGKYLNLLPERPGDRLDLWLLPLQGEWEAGPVPRTLS